MGTTNKGKVVLMDTEQKLLPISHWSEEQLCALKRKRVQVSFINENTGEFMDWKTYTALVLDVEREVTSVYLLLRPEGQPRPMYDAVIRVKAASEWTVCIEVKDNVSEEEILTHYDPEVRAFALPRPI
jgi:hypothetical protein